MFQTKGTCKKCGKTYGSYANLQSARHNVSTRTCKKGGKCEADV